MTAHTGRALIEDIDAADPTDGELAFWWLGQHGFVLKMGGLIFYLDPYLSDAASRTVRPLVAPEQVANADFITGSHDHSDHIDRPIWPILAAASPGATFVVPMLARQRGLAGELRIPAERIEGIADGMTIHRAHASITGVAAAHERLDADEQTGLHPSMGFVIEAGGVRVYHAGDTCRYEGLETRLKQLGPFDVMFLPINGRDAKRLAGGCIGNMTYQEAVDLAGEVGPRLAVPAHFEMFANNSEDPGNFVEYMAVKFPSVPTLVPEHGRRVVVRKGGEPEIADI